MNVSDALATRKSVRAFKPDAVPRAVVEEILLKAARAPFHEVIRDYLKVPQEEMIFCGMAVGYADDDAAINSLVSERAALSEWAVIRETA